GRRSRGAAPLPRRELRAVANIAMGLGPSLSIRQSQQLVLTPQLRQAIQLLQLSNLELDAFLAEEISKNPLLESAPEEGGDQAPTDLVEESDSEEAPEDPGADNIILGQA